MQLTYSGCTPSQIALIHQGVQKHGGTVTAGISYENNIATTTHVVCHWEDATLRQCRRTLKTMTAIALGKWIVDFR